MDKAESSPSSPSRNDSDDSFDVNNENSSSSGSDEGARRTPRKKAPRNCNEKHLLDRSFNRSNAQPNAQQEDEPAPKKKKVVENPKAHQLNLYLQRNQESDDNSSDSDPDVIDTYKLPIDRNYRQYRYFIRALRNRRKLVAKLKNDLDLEEKEMNSICKEIYRSRKFRNHSRENLLLLLRHHDSRAKILRDCDLIDEDYDSKIIPVNTDAIAVRKYLRQRFQCVEEMDTLSKSRGVLNSIITQELRIAMSFYNRSDLPNLVQKYCYQARVELIIRRELINFGITSIDKIPAQQWEKDLVCEGVKRLSKSEKINDQTFNHAFNEVLIRMLKGESVKKSVQEPNAPRSKTPENRATAPETVTSQPGTTRSLASSTVVSPAQRHQQAPQNPSEPPPTPPSSNVCPSPDVSQSSVEQRNEPPEIAQGMDMPLLDATQATPEQPKEEVPSLELCQSAELFGEESDEEMDEYSEEETQEERTSSPSEESTMSPPVVVKTEDKTQETNNNASSQESPDKIGRTPLKTSPGHIAVACTLDLTQDDDECCNVGDEDDDCIIVGESFPNGRRKDGPTRVIKDPPADDDIPNPGNVRVKLEVSPPATETSANNVDSSYRIMYSKEESKDMTFNIGNNIVKAHKFVLKTKCESFYKAVVPQTGNNIKLEDVSFEVFDAFIKYLYFGKFEENENEAADLLEFGVKFNLIGLTSECENYLIKLIDKSNAVQYLLKAHLLQVNVLKVEAMAFVKDNLTELQDTPAFKELLKHPDLLDAIY